MCHPELVSGPHLLCELAELMGCRNKFGMTDNDKTNYEEKTHTPVTVPGIKCR
jgi:hypothetical protein